MGLGDLHHAREDLLVGDHVVAKKDKEGLVAGGVGGTADGVAEAARLALEAEVDGKRPRLGDGLGVAGLAAADELVLEREVAREVAHDLGLGLRGHDDALVDLLGRERLLHHVLDDGLVEDGQHLLRRDLGAG